MKKLFLDFVFWKSPGKTHFHSVDCSISVHSVLRTPCTEKEQSTPWKWFYLTFSRKLHKKLLLRHFLQYTKPPSKGRPQPSAFLNPGFYFLFFLLQPRDLILPSGKRFSYDITEGWTTITLPGGATKIGIMVQSGLLGLQKILLDLPGLSEPWLTYWKDGYKLVQVKWPYFKNIAGLKSDSHFLCLSLIHI